MQGEVPVKAKTFEQAQKGEWAAWGVRIIQKMHAKSPQARNGGWGHDRWDWLAVARDVLLLQQAKERDMFFMPHRRVAALVAKRIDAGVPRVTFF